MLYSSVNLLHHVLCLFVFLHLIPNYFFNTSKKWRTQSCKSSRAFQVGPGSGLSLSKCFGPLSGLYTQVWYTIRSNDFFLSWSTFILLTVVTCEWIDRDFSSANSIWKHTCVLLFSAGISVTHFFRRRCEEISTRWHWVEKINRSRDSSLVLRNDGLQSVGHRFMPMALS